ncbi:phosphate starvation-inducible protein PhoH [Sulfoacidibacillus thermotolerans]|uniref:PhoH-like protein n=1 Tax=Sulfoacidibacillus thermotolerans TaxID=1765684 RepID=A0A2U3D6H3_SULT2|nr:phosphate starvation-inducible protein PhoH [Sulfoacidibacillus thermotolerans]
MSEESVVSQKILLRDNEEARAIFGPQDAYIRMLDQAFACTLINRGNELSVQGTPMVVEQVVELIGVFKQLIRKGHPLSERDVLYALELQKKGDLAHLLDLFQEDLAQSFKGKVIRVKTIGQRAYVEAIRKHDIVFGVGPAGTGKTYLAVVLAYLALKNGLVKRIVLTRPAVEAGENLGFLPGDLQEKVDPYLRPLYDALHDVMGPEQLARSMERGLVEVAPLAYMRGRTLEDAFVILDEAQNTTPEQMKMFLTRLGFGSKMVITGDITQVDLPRGKRSGLREALRILSDIDGIAFVVLEESDVIRHQLVQKIIHAYAKDEVERG